MLLPNQVLLLPRSHSPHKRPKFSKNHKLVDVGCVANQGIEQKNVTSRKIKEVVVLEIPTNKLTLLKLKINSLEWFLQ
ncbi:hypothetical protein RchiOBHm_Chr7g0234541 [Rosa chinensis]|uniref:Uncharacterized protein n=1 Tax=Rosa chinensis TaxID=74649 RepID=A0A2P6PGG6_ROSCH|nr:hypothetical protein RchiOBHm_Chr7g0234541 [Rosa chinensis]